MQFIKTSLISLKNDLPVITLLNKIHLLKKWVQETRHLALCIIKNIHSIMQPFELLSRTTDLLSRKTSLNESDISELQELLREHNRLYYTEQSPIISDQEYDMLFRALKTLEQTYQVSEASSPTNRIDVLVSSQFQK